MLHKAKVNTQTSVLHKLLDQTRANAEWQSKQEERRVPAQQSWSVWSSSDVRAPKRNLNNESRRRRRRLLDSPRQNG